MENLDTVGFDLSYLQSLNLRCIICCTSGYYNAKGIITREYMLLSNTDTNSYQNQSNPWPLHNIESLNSRSAVCRIRI